MTPREPVTPRQPVPAPPSPPSTRGRVVLALAMTLLVVGVAGYAFRDRIPAALLPAKHAAPAPTPTVAESPAAPAATPAPAAAPSGPDRVRGVAVTVVAAASRTVVERLPVTGTLVPREEIQVGPEIDGYRVVEILAEEGDRVEKGQVLARLSRDMLDTVLAQNTANGARANAAIAQQKAQLEQARAQQVEAQAAVERARTLIKTGATSQEVLDQRERAVRVTVAQVAAAQEAVTAAEAEAAQTRAVRDEIEVRLAHTEIRAPEAGVISARTIRIGAIVLSANTEPLFRIVKNGAMDLDADVPESTLARIRTGMGVRVTPAGFDEPVAGTVRLVGAKVDAGTRLARVAVALPSDPRLKPGAYARGVIEIARRDGVAVPLSAVQFSPDGTFVLVVKDEIIEQRPVTTGLQGDGFVEIASGLASGEQVVARAGGFLRGGDRVTPVPAPDAATPAPRGGA
ncbi:efflux RND transporter periplasmic adaptor subunit [Ancylobacter sp. 6x-1]|uniref:Efflux RND transporter periplasmic adaptor subunit n=1 Tax=Ancylobacter crimeensis TaxID=2579147 RepID=A0ABT0DD22_9HYPH|nr:efflux RND transporter periplasmic adaptor subunit [Ancylobacter crimeensis]MCK0197862.1 efflux RND transporter periplasmic adaptor subunit [Ancylobacter crimeensis]